MTRPVALWQRLSCTALLCLAAAAPLRAEVTAVTPQGFALKYSARVPVAPGAVAPTLLAVGRWWNPAHSYSGQAANLSLEPRVGGCFCERWEGGEVEHARLVLRMPQDLRLVGAFGPLQSQGLTGSLSFHWKGDGDAVQLSAAYSVGGYAEGGVERWAPIVDRVLAEQFSRLVRTLETGRPD